MSGTFYTTLFRIDLILTILRFDTLNVLVPNEDPINVTFNVWDLGQDVAASSDVLGEQTWECDLDFSINVPVTIIGGSSSVISAAGESMGVFAVTKFDGTGTNLMFEAYCTSPETGR